MSDFLALVVAFTLPPLIRPGFAGPPSPEGEGFGAGELGGCRGKSTLAAARRLASPFGRGAQCTHWAERVCLLGAVLRKKRLPPGGKLAKIFDF